MKHDNDDPHGRMLFSTLGAASDIVASGRRVPPEELLPGYDDPLEGSVPNQFLPDVTTFDWFNPTVWANADPADLSGIDLASITAATGPGLDGDGLDFFRGGEAPDNFTNRNNPLYVSRRDFAEAIAPRLAEMFGVSAEGSAGYLRTPQTSDADPGGRSPNSDHFSGGAIDFYGDDAELTDLRNWLVAQPFTAFVRWQSESHTDHLHVSFDLGWIAQNYFSGQNLPGLSREPSQPPREAPASTLVQKGLEKLKGIV